MNLIHVSPEVNRESIFRQGLLLSYCRTKRVGIFTAKRHRLFMTIPHVRARYHLRKWDLVAIIRCKVQPGWCVRLGGGLWLVKRDIPPELLTWEWSESFCPSPNGSGVQLIV
jgi:hypothetical protein